VFRFSPLLYGIFLSLLRRSDFSSPLELFPRKDYVLLGNLPPFFNSLLESFFPHDEGLLPFVFSNLRDVFEGVFTFPPCFERGTSPPIGTPLFALPFFVRTSWNSLFYPFRFLSLSASCFFPLWTRQLRPHVICSNDSFSPRLSLPLAARSILDKHTPVGVLLFPSLFWKSPSPPTPFSSSFGLFKAVDAPVVHQHPSYRSLFL